MILIGCLLQSWVFLACVRQMLFLLSPVKWALRWLAWNTSSSTFCSSPSHAFSHHLPCIYPVKSRPTISFMTVMILILFRSAFFTDVVGVHAIFSRDCYAHSYMQSISICIGAFVAGIIIPCEGRLVTTLTENLEDTVLIIFLSLVHSHPYLIASTAQANFKLTMLWNSTSPSLAFP